ncbi:hypothetical protein [Streptomyces sp. NPDC056069]|uniref:hypothetical protein n=1 Tax=Streptomyces sp. NPDC056069 TaxID=3345702 RepID=UPI0035DE33ED
MTRWTRRANTVFLLMEIAGMLLLLGIPSAFGMWDDDRLHMTDDYAAITAGASVTVLLICVVELHLAAGRAKQSVVANDSVPLDYDLTRPEDQMVRNFSHTIWWLLACLVLCVSLLLTALWAAIEDHGPARWVAWTTLLSTAFGLLTVLSMYMSRAANELVFAYRALPHDDETTTSDGSPAPEG